MRIVFGIDQYLKTQGVTQEIVWDSSQVTNPHIQIMGMSGSGKTYNLRNIAKHFSEHSLKNGLYTRTHIFDVHGDIRCDNESVVTYSENNGFGINPLRVSSDPEFGGVRKRIRSFINTLSKSTAKLGVKQEAALTRILEQLYEYYHFDKNDPETWKKKRIPPDPDIAYLDVPFDRKGRAKQLGALWNPSFKCWYLPKHKYQGDIMEFPLKVPAVPKTQPSVSDLHRMIQLKMEESFVGVGGEGTKALKDLNRVTSRYNKIIADHGGDGIRIDDLPKDVQNELESSQNRVRLEIEDYFKKSVSNQNLMDLLTFSSTDVLMSVQQRIDTLISSGVFRDTPPPFDPDAPVFRHNIRTLSHEEQKMFTMFKLEELFLRAVQMGEVKRGEIRDVIIVDEASKFFDKDKRNPLNYIALEGRKFGLMLVAASQAPTHFDEDFLGSVATKIILGIDEIYWKKSCQQLNLSEERMKFVIPQKQMLCQIKQMSAPTNPWVGVSIQ